MREIIKILKKHLLKIIFVIILLVLMAKCDLALPSYTSNIVNVGIQQNGIETSVPIVMRKSTYNQLININKNLEKKNHYTLISKNNLSRSEYEKYVKKYPLLDKEDLYILNDLSKKELSEIDDEFQNSLIMYSFLSKQNELDNSTNLNENMEQFKEKSSTLGKSVLKQYAITVIKSEYETIGFDMTNFQMKYIISTGIKMLAVTLLAAIITVAISFLSSKISAMFSLELRSKIVNKVMRFSNEDFEKLSASSLITRSTNDVQQIQMLINMLLRIVIYAPIIGVGAFIKVKDSSMAWVIGIAILAILVVIAILFFVALPNFQKVQNLLDKVNQVSREILTGLPVIKAFATEKHELKKFDNANKDLTKVNTFVNKVMSIMMPTMTFIMSAISILIIWVGADNINKYGMQIGDLMAFIQYSMQILTAFLMISMMSIFMPRAIVSIKRVSEIFNREEKIKEIDKPLKLNKEEVKIQFKDVYFRYPDAEEDVLTNISFAAKSGETIAFIGSTGSGKSSLINLIPRFFDVTGGKILINDIDIRKVSLKDLRDIIGFVPQKGMLFSGTIESNIKLGNDKISLTELQKICEVSQANEFILEKEKKYKDPIAQSGSNISGGQKQRLAIARAIAKKPSIYIFDDSFSALDFKTDAKLRKELKKYTNNSIMLIVAQRISSILNADKIIVLEQGKIVGSGTHSELLKNCDVYKEIALSQLGEEELKHV